MANNEGVDIIIKAQDQYTKTINNITASNELFGKSLKNTEKELAAVTKLMVTMRVQGIDPTDAAMVKLKADYDKLSQSLSSGEGTLKSSSKQWTSLALVVQDLPYGFRGIQNNLPALFGSIAAAAGPAYFAFSALVAIVTAFEKELSGLFTTVTAADREQKVYNSSIEAGQKAYADSKLQVMQLNEQVKEAAGNKDKEKKAVDDYNSSVGVSLGRLDTFKQVQDSLINQGDKYVNFIFKLNMANAAAAKVAEESANMMIASFKDPSKFINNWDKLFSVQFNLFGNLAAAAIGTAEELAKRGKENQQAAIKDAGLNAVAAEKVYNTLKKELEDAKKELKFGSFADPKDTSKALRDLEKANQDRLKAIQNANQAEIKAYTQTLNERDKKEYEAGLTLAQNLQTMRSAGYTDATTYYTAYRAEMDKIDAYYNNKEIEEAKKTAEKIAKDAEVIDNRQLQNSLDALKIESDVAMKIANLSGNANAADRIKILQDYKNSLYNLASVGGYTAEQFDKIDDALRRVDGAIEGSKDRVRDYTITWQETVNTINGILTNLDINMLTNFGEQIGNMLAGGKFDISQMGTILADALSSIGKALIAFAITNGAAMELFKNPKTWPLALAAGIAAVAAGTALKAKISDNAATPFANGGIVSGPTMGLVGEYPGAQSNPEVIAPLDKLKDMIGGGGGGTFVLRGQDLLLSVNRAQKASNLKGQNISLA
jgi:hypothetical protein